MEGSDGTVDKTSTPTGDVTGMDEPPSMGVPEVVVAGDAEDDGDDEDGNCEKVGDTMAAFVMGCVVEEAAIS